MGQYFVFRSDRIGTIEITHDGYHRVIMGWSDGLWHVRLTRSPRKAAKLQARALRREAKRKARIEGKTNEQTSTDSIRT